MQKLKSIQNRIYEIRGQRVMLDNDLAELYEVPTKSLNLSVKRNIERFPSDFMFQLTKVEYEVLRFQIETSSPGEKGLRLQNETSKHGGRRYMPYAFTEQGVAMLSGVLSSKKAIGMNINIMRAFADVRRIVMQQLTMNEKLKKLQTGSVSMMYSYHKFTMPWKTCWMKKQPKENGKTGKGLDLRNNQSQVLGH